MIWVKVWTSVKYSTIQKLRASLKSNMELLDVEIYCPKSLESERIAKTSGYKIIQLKCVDLFYHVQAGRLLLRSDSLVSLLYLLKKTKVYTEKAKSYMWAILNMTLWYYWKLLNYSRTLILRFFNLSFVWNVKKKKTFLTLAVQF